jgi:LuxR family maltose regulon positive regulatory protein
MSRITLAEASEHESLQLLESIYAVGKERKLPRLCIASLTEQIRLHARKFRAETCRHLLDQLNSLVSEEGLERGPIWWHDVSIQRFLSQIFMAIAARDWRRALDPIHQCTSFINRSGALSLYIELLGLRALALYRCGENVESLLCEALDLAKAYGLRRVFADTHPELVELISQIEPSLVAESIHSASLHQSPPPKLGQQSTSAQSVALTPKEHEVLELLNRNLSNKEIGLAMQVSDQAIKWHLKNLFLKLDAGSRKHLVQRSKMLGLLQH